MKHIKVITYNNFPFGGAPANFVRYFTFALSSIENEIEVVRPTGNIFGRRVETDNKAKGKIDNVCYRHLGFIKRPQNFIGKFIDSFWGFIFTPIYLIYSNIKKKIDLIVLYNVQLTNILFIIVLKKLFTRKIVIILPEFYEKPKKNLFLLIQWYNFYLGLKYFTKYADGVITLSYFMKNYLISKLNIKRPILIIPNLMNPNEFNNLSVLPFKEKKITIGYVGTPTKKDGIFDLIKSFSLLNQKNPQTHLLIIGDTTGNNSVIPLLKNYALQLGVQDDHITFTGLVSYKTIPSLLNSCQVLALTRPNGIFAEAGFPTKLGEYFASKKPVLVTRVGDISNYFDNEVHLIIVPPEDIDSIVDGFEKIINNPELSQKISANGYQWMDENLNYINQSNRIISFINLI